MWRNIFVIFNWKKYTLRFTNHSLERMQERWISILTLKESFEKYDRHFESYRKEIVEKDMKLDIIRTVFIIKTNNIILITTMLLWK